jgi:hypothetical protein
MRNLILKLIALALLIGFALVVLIRPELTNAGNPTQGVQSQEQEAQVKNQSTLFKTQPLPSLDYSVERQNLIERMKRLNDRNLIGYIYLMSDTGQTVASYVTKGKVSSLTSYLTGGEILVDWKGRPCSDWATGSTCYAVESPDMDGSYGNNPDGIFFFTDTGAMVEWTGPYVWTDQPLSVRGAVTLYRKIK